MAHNFKRPKAYLKMGNYDARFGKMVRIVVKDQIHLDALLSQIPEESRPGELERMRPFLSFEPEPILSNLDKPGVPDGSEDSGQARSAV